MRHFGRLIGLILFFFILVITPCAFWAFNIDRVVMDRQTYKTALQSQDFYNKLLPALIDSAATSTNTDINATAQALMSQLSIGDWSTLSSKLLPAQFLKDQIDGNINNLFDWLDGTGNIPNITFNLKPLKTTLTSNSIRDTASFIVSKMKPCLPDQAQQIASNPDSSQLPICNPLTPDVQAIAVNSFTTHLNALGAQLPDVWRLSDQLKTIASKLPPPPQYKADIFNSNNEALNEYTITQGRTFLWISSRLVILLFLIPIAIFSLIIIVTIRSSKGLFRWLGWALIVSGVFTLIPAVFQALGSLNMMGGIHNSIQQGVSGNGMIVQTLVGGMFDSVISGLDLALIVQVGIVLLVGFVALFLSVLLPAPDPDVSREQVEREQLIQQYAAFGGGSTPFPMGSTPAPYGSSPVNYAPYPSYPTPSTTQNFPSQPSQPATPSPAPPLPPPAKPDDPVADLFPPKS